MQPALTKWSQEGAADARAAAAVRAETGAGKEVLAEVDSAVEETEAEEMAGAALGAEKEVAA